MPSSCLPASSESLKGHLFIQGVDQLDMAYWHQDALWGGSYEVDLEVWGELDSQGFVCDFSELKALLRDFLKTSFDHRFVAPLQHPHYELISWGVEEMCWHSRPSYDLPWSYRAPRSAFLPLDHFCYHKDLLASEIQNSFQKKLRSLPQKEGVEGVKVFLRERESKHSSSAVTLFPYTHGITAHKGLCHRLWHGHHSLLEVKREGLRDERLERALVQNHLGGAPVHIAEPAQILTPGVWSAGECGPAEQICELAYTGASGAFYARMPAHRVFLSTPATSVECLAITFAELLKKGSPHQRFDVKVFEGLHKGGLCSR